jgi:Ankyrin repeat
VWAVQLYTTHCITLLYHILSQHDVTALMAASLGGNPSIVAALLEKKAGVNAVSNVSVALMLS